MSTVTWICLSNKRACHCLLHHLPQKKAKDTQLNKLMKELMLYTRYTNLFGTGHLHHVPSASWKRCRFHNATACDIASKTEICSPFSNIEVNPDLLSFLAIRGTVSRYTVIVFLRIVTTIIPSSPKLQKRAALRSPGLNLLRLKKKQANEVEKYVLHDKVFYWLLACSQLQSERGILLTLLVSLLSKLVLTKVCK